ncbi:hypothetical protein [Thaumasiovibrio sp. DFM-14]|uniref:hypothetical protein n=1 Tax=Thaumasiovibrio sp. DFM-14 TaxID=3384792 RepID=UPI0039A2A3C3
MKSSFTISDMSQIAGQSKATLYRAFSLGGGAGSIGALAAIMEAHYYITSLEVADCEFEDFEKQYGNYEKLSPELRREIPLDVKVRYLRTKQRVSILLAASDLCAVDYERKHKNGLTSGELLSALKAEANNLFEQSSMTYKDVADLTGMDKRTIMGILNFTPVPSLGRLEQVMRALGYTSITSPFADHLRYMVLKNTDYSTIYSDGYGPEVEAVAVRAILSADSDLQAPIIQQVDALLTLNSKLGNSSRH